MQEKLEKILLLILTFNVHSVIILITYFIRKYRHRKFPKLTKNCTVCFAYAHVKGQKKMRFLEYLAKVFKNLNAPQVGWSDKMGLYFWWILNSIHRMLHQWKKINWRHRLACPSLVFIAMEPKVLLKTVKTIKSFYRHTCQMCFSPIFVRKKIKNLCLLWFWDDSAGRGLNLTHLLVSVVNKFYCWIDSFLSTMYQI